jgi:hypothetical protein
MNLADGHHQILLFFLLLLQVLLVGMLDMDLELIVFVVKARCMSVGDLN